MRINCEKNLFFKEREEEKINIENIGKRKSNLTPGLIVSDTERIIVGEKISADKRKVFTPLETTHWDTGSIGFLDFFHNEEEKIISIGELGIEPKYRSKGYCKKLIEKVEEIARERNVEEIKFIAVEEKNIPMVELLGKRDYKPSRGVNPEIFVKKLEKTKEDKKRY